MPLSGKLHASTTIFTNPPPPSPPPGAEEAVEGDLSFETEDIIVISSLVTDNYIAVVTTEPDAPVYLLDKDASLVQRISTGQGEGKTWKVAIIGDYLVTGGSERLELEGVEPEPHGKVRENKRGCLEIFSISSGKSIHHIQYSSPTPVGDLILIPKNSALYHDTHVLVVREDIDLVDVSTGTVIRSFNAGEELAKKQWDTAFLGRYILAVAKNSVIIWDYETAELVRTWKIPALKDRSWASEFTIRRWESQGVDVDAGLAGIFGFEAWEQNGQSYVATGSFDGFLRIWDSEGNLLHAIRAHNPTPNSLTLINHLKHTAHGLLSFGVDGRACLWSTEALPTLLERVRDIQITDLATRNRVIYSENTILCTGKDGVDFLNVCGRFNAVKAWRFDGQESGKIQIVVPDVFTVWEIGLIGGKICAVLRKRGDDITVQLWDPIEG